MAPYVIFGLTVVFRLRTSIYYFTKWLRCRWVATEFPLNNVWEIRVRVRFGVRFRVMVRFRVRVRVSVRVNYFRDSFSILLRAQHYSMF